MHPLEDIKLAVIGLGYVGLPLALEFSAYRSVVGFDISTYRIEDLNNGIDITREVSSSELLGAKKIRFTANESMLKECNCFIITVPTPVNEFNAPDLSALIAASKIVGNVLKKGDLVIYESTVYPGVTEEECAPTLEKQSGLKFNVDFYCGYSPERINPGDKVHRISNIMKITSGSTPEAADLVDNLYSQIVKAGTHKASSIKVAEAAKVIENTQRDINIALINELAIIFNKMGIDTESVLRAAETKWNFMPFRPGLVGGHCIGVDPYYLTHKAESIGYHPELILSGRRLNDGMACYVANQLVKCMTKKEISINQSNVLIMGLTFKENCPDTRNSKVFDVIEELSSFGCIVDVYDPWVIDLNINSKNKFTLLNNLIPGKYDAILLAVAHEYFMEMGQAQIRSLGKISHVLYDLKYVLEGQDCDLRL